MENAVAELTKNIERLQRQEAMDKKLSLPTNQPILNQPSNKFDGKTGT